MPIPNSGEVISPRGSQRSMPSHAIAMGTPASNTMTAGRDEQKTLLSQKCNGHKPAFIAKPNNIINIYKVEEDDCDISECTAENPKSSAITAASNNASNKTKSAAIIKLR